MILVLRGRVNGVNVGFDPKEGRDRYTTFVTIAPEQRAGHQSPIAILDFQGILGEAVKIVIELEGRDLKGE